MSDIIYKSFRKILWILRIVVLKQMRYSVYKTDGTIGRKGGSV